MKREIGVGARLEQDRALRGGNATRLGEIIQSALSVAGMQTQ